MKEKMPAPQRLAEKKKRWVKAGCMVVQMLEVKAILQELLGDWVGKPSSMSQKASGIKHSANPC